MSETSRGTSNKVRTWDILVPTFYARTPLYLQLLEQFDKQIRPGVRLVVERSPRDPEHIAEKQQRMLGASDADYTSTCSDDALLHPEYVSLIHGAMQADLDGDGPDVVGFKLGMPQAPQHHSIAFHGIEELAWHPSRPDLFWGPRGRPRWCDLGTWMPVKRSIGSQCRFELQNGDADDTWTRRVMATGLVRSEVYFSEVLVTPQYLDAGFHGAWREVEPTPHPERPYVKYV